MIKTSLAKEAFHRIAVTDATYDVALLYYIKQLGGKIKEVHVKYNHDESSTSFHCLYEWTSPFSHSGFVTQGSTNIYRPGL
ncbi:MAG: hypothetical protein ACP5UZ_08945 [Thermoplasmata archaeon]